MLLFETMDDTMFRRMLMFSLWIAKYICNVIGKLYIFEAMAIYTYHFKAHQT